MTSNQLSDITHMMASFPFSTDFVDWISNGDFTFFILSETKNSRTYIRTTQFIVKNMTIMHGLIRILRNSIDHQILSDFINTRKSIGRYIALNPELGLKKYIINKTTTGRDYHIVSHIRYNNRTCGHCSELFNMSHVAHLFSKKISHFDFNKI